MDEAATGDATSVYAFPRNLVLAASAGTGKTHRLVGIAVHLVMGACQAPGGGLREPVDPGRLVATTFSRKAAAEIRARLIGELERLAERDPRAAYRQDLGAARAVAGLAPWSDAELRSRARRALSAIGRAQIGTLHGFAASLVRAHALELGASPSFELVDESTARARAEEAIARVVEARAEEEEIGWLVASAGGVTRLMEQLLGLVARVSEQGTGASELALGGDRGEDGGARRARTGARGRRAARPRRERPPRGVRRVRRSG
jgi:ATP-dependent helicase/nuclease subunit A